jgi:hypothetical protein
MLSQIVRATRAVWPRRLTYKTSTDFIGSFSSCKVLARFVGTMKSYLARAPEGATQAAVTGQAGQRQSAWYQGRSGRSDYAMGERLPPCEVLGVQSRSASIRLRVGRRSPFSAEPRQLQSLAWGVQEPGAPAGGRGQTSESKRPSAGGEPQGQRERRGRSVGRLRALRQRAASGGLRARRALRRSRSLWPRWSDQR